mmetsp:Transcript_11897/g.13846  ORF Transcript_11897/g.13846 Transcript_11897/m.13846 type:complete len:420 (-) Transcript_11897:2257-3516(-)
MPYVCAEYIWIDADGGYRSKTKVIHGVSSVTLNDLPEWNYDGSSTGQAPGDDSEVKIMPCAIFPDPFRRNGNHVLVVTDTSDADKNALPTNSRFLAAKVFAEKPEEKPWFGIEQEYTMFKYGRPLGWPESKARNPAGPTATYGYPAPQGPYYCSAGADRAFGREIVEEHMDACTYAGITISGINAEVMPGQWEYQVGPCVGIDSGDHMTVSRYILNRVAEKHGVKISYHPKPIPGDWNGAGCHTNFSTEKMRTDKQGYEKYIVPAIKALGERHEQHINAYGSDNDQRLTGKHETGNINSFSWDVADRGCSVRVPNSTKDEGQGYFEDRRPASNMDPYIVTAMIYDSSILGAKFASAFDSIKSEGVDIEGGVVKATAPAVEVAADDTLEMAEKAADVPTAAPRGEAAPNKKKKKKDGCVV